MSGDFFKLTWKKICILVVAWFVSIILHNLLSALLNTEEVFFFTLVVLVIPGYILVSLLVTVIKKLGQIFKQSD